MEVTQIVEKVGNHTKTWAECLFHSAPKDTPTQPPEQHQMYLGEDEEKKYPGIDELFTTQDHMEEQPPKYGPRVEISKEKYVSLFKQWRGALILKFLGKIISYRLFDQKIRELWNLELGYELTDLVEGYYVVRFFSREDYLHVLEGGPWVILGYYLIVMKWSPKFHPTADSIASTLVWVRFPRFPPEILDEEILTSMGDMVGRTVKVDATSLIGLRARFTRVCVEVDLAAPLISSLTVLNFDQTIEYEGLHLIYFKCGMYGHKGDECPSLEAKAAESKPPTK